MSVPHRSSPRRAPFYRGETGKRRGGWNAFFDDPANHPEGTRHVQGTFTLRGAKARSIGDRVELVFDGMRMGGFEGALSYTFYPGSRLIQQEAVLTTNDPDVAYYYDAGLDMAAPADRTAGNNMRSEIAYYDTSGTLKKVYSTGFRAEREPVQVRYRTLAAKTAGGSVAVFPAPHQYFFPRDFSSNLAYLWHRSWRGRVGIGVRQLRDENWQYYPWVNAPPGRAQRMGVFFLVSDGTPEAALSHVLRYTNRDRFVGASRLQDAEHALASRRHRAGDGQRPEVDAAVQAGAESDGRRRVDDHGLSWRRASRDLTDLRLDELDAYFKALKAQSDPEFLLIPAEEANVHLGGHWSVVFPKPVYWFMNRPKDAGAAFEMQHPKYGKVYSTANAQEMLDLVRREGGYMYQTHPRTKGSTGFPDKILETDHFRDPRYLGAGWKAMPADLSSPRLGDRSFDLLDDLSNQGLRKRIFGEVDMFQFDHTDELYAHMNINYIKLDRLPAFEQWGRRARAARARRLLHDDRRSAAAARRPVEIDGERSDRVCRRAVDVSAPLRRNRVERRQDDAPRDDSARRHARIRQAHVRMARPGGRLAMGARRRVGCRGERGVCESCLEETESENLRSGK